MEKKARRHVKRGDIIAEVEHKKGLIEIEIFDEGIIDKFLIQEGTKVPVGTVMALLQPSGVSLDTKKKKRSCPIATNRRKTKVRLVSTAEMKNKSITARPKNCRRKPHQTRISERNRS
jgi:pyruvate dehydrogenase E2 component (dihydrolipoamide acetyltransferase)